MNIERIYTSLNSFVQKITVVNKNGISANVFTTEYINLFEALNISERKTLKYLSLYEYMLELYDRLKNGSSIGSPEIQSLQQKLSKPILLKKSLENARINPVSDDNISYLNIIFPVKSHDSNIAAFKDEVVWFFDALKQSQVIFDGIDDEIKILNVENEWLSISVIIDWKMVLVIAYIIKQLKLNSSTANSDNKTVQYLHSRDLPEKEVAKIKELLEQKDESSTEKIIFKIDKLFSKFDDLNLAEEWKTNIRLLIKKLREAFGRDYKIECEIPKIESRIETTNKIEMTELKNIITYDRNITDSDLKGERPKLEDKS